MKIYEDPYVYVELPEKPAVKGHMQVFPQKDAKSLDDLDHDEIQHMFQVASRAATVLFENLGAHGTNIILSEGSVFNERVKLDVIARMQDDDVNTTWEPGSIDPGDMEQIMDSIKGNTLVIGHSESGQETSSSSEIPKIVTGKEGNYLTRRVKKLP